MNLRLQVTSCSFTSSHTSMLEFKVSWLLNFLPEDIVEWILPPEDKSLRVAAGGVDKLNSDSHLLENSKALWNKLLGGKCSGGGRVARVCISILVSLKTISYESVLRLHETTFSQYYRGASWRENASVWLTTTSSTLVNEIF